MAEQPLRVLILGAHPDDAEAHAGGLMALYAEGGHTVKWVAATNGDAGHHQKSGPELAAIRKAEAAAAAAVIGVEAEVWDNHDGQLMPTLELRWQIIREIRTFKPDLVLTHRPNDYHPDHRAVGQAVQDASYMVTVPPIVPDAPALRSDPVVAYMCDRFTKPTRLQGDVVIDVTDKLDKIVQMLHRHTSQVYEWLPYNMGKEQTVPADEVGRKKWLRGFVMERWGWIADQYRDELVATYGEQRGRAAQHAEAYEISEYAGRWNDSVRRRLFPFLPG